MLETLTDFKTENKMREILFRGKTETDKWVYGALDNTLNWADFIIVHENGFGIKNRILPETIGQFTGLTDKNGTKIFEGDIIRILYTDWTSKSEDDTRTLEEYLISISDIGKVVFNTDRWELEFISSIYPEEVYTDSIRCGLHGRIEVIGNIYENLELLK